MDVIRLAGNPLDGICFADYNPETNQWAGPPGVGILMSRDLEKRLNFTTELIYCNNIWGQEATSNPEDPVNWGMVARLDKGEADWTPCSLTRTTRRARVVNFSPIPLNLGELLMASRLPEASGGGGAGTTEHIQFGSVLMPFTSAIWMFLTISLLVYGILTAFLKEITNRNALADFYCVLVEWIDLFCVLLMRSLPVVGSTSLRGPPTMRLMFILWSIPSLILAIMYSSELISFLSTSHHSSLVSTWEQLFDILERREMHAASFSGSWFKAEAEKLLSRPDDIHFLDSYHKAFDAMYQGGYVWIDSSSELIPTMSRYGEFPGRKTYIMGEGAGFGSTWEGFAFSPARPEVQHRFDPWIRRYFEKGHIMHWTKESMAQLAIYARQGGISLHDPSADVEKEVEEDRLTFLDSIGSYVCYALFLCLALVAMLAEQCSVFKKRHPGLLQRRRPPREPPPGSLTSHVTHWMDHQNQNLRLRRLQTDRKLNDSFYDAAIESISHYKRELLQSRQPPCDGHPMLVSYKSWPSGRNIGNVSYKPGDVFRTSLDKFESH